MFLTADLWPTICALTLRLSQIDLETLGASFALSPPHQSVNHNCCSIYERTDCGAR